MFPQPEALAALHAQCFTAPPPWSAQAFAATLAAPETFVLGDTTGFLIGRAAAGEAELVTLAVAPASRRRGIARRLVTAFTEAAGARGADAAFLEVAADNAPARALYAACGWVEVGRRPRYYGPAQDAIIMRVTLGPGQDSG